MWGDGQPCVFIEFLPFHKVIPSKLGLVFLDPRCAGQCWFALLHFTYTRHAVRPPHHPRRSDAQTHGQISSCAYAVFLIFNSFSNCRLVSLPNKILFENL